MREDDTELVVQAMEEETQFGRFVHGSPSQELLDAERARRHQAQWRPSACQTALSATAGRPAPFGSRHSVATKIRTHPPAVPTYSIFPLESPLSIARRPTPTSPHAFLIETGFPSHAF